MPFVKNDRRQPLLDKSLEPKEVGDLCFLQYVPLIRAWRKERRWTTAHNMCRNLFETTDEQTAKFLAFLEFYIREVHPYEDEKIKENGDVE